MNFDLSEEHLMIKQAARDFAQNELKDGVIDRDSKCEYPEKQVKRMAELGFLGMTVSTKYGGGGMDTMSYAIAVKEISKMFEETKRGSAKEVMEYFEQKKPKGEFVIIVEGK